jgi:hypothetical protein
MAESRNLHLVRSQDYQWLLQLTAPGLAAAGSRWLAQQGLSSDQAERGVAAITRALASDGPLTNGVFRPFALVDGRAAGTWRLRGGQVTLHPFAEMQALATAALEEEARDIARFFGLPYRPMLDAGTARPVPQP